MPTGAPHPCTAPGCPALVRGRGRCDAHERKAEARRGSWRDRGYSSRKWDGPNGIRLTHLRGHPLCVACAAENPPRVTPANTVDHRVSWQSGETEAERTRLFEDPSNLDSMCASCHGKKTAREDGSFGRPRR